MPAGPTIRQGIKLELTGLNELNATLAGVSEAMRTTIISAAVTEGAKPLVRYVKMYCPVDTGALRASIASKTLRNRKTGKAVAMVGPSTASFRGNKKVKKGESKLDADKPSRYAHLVEFGHMRKKGGFTAAKPFMRPAVAAAGPSIVRGIVAGASKGLIAAAKRLAKNNAR